MPVYVVVYDESNYDASWVSTHYVSVDKAAAIASRDELNSKYRHHAWIQVWENGQETTEWVN